MSDITDTTPPAAPKKPAKKAKKTPEQKAAKKQTQKDSKAALTKKQTVTHTVQTQNGQPLHFCEDKEWRTDEDLRKLTEKE